MCYIECVKLHIVVHQLKGLRTPAEEIIIIIIKIYVSRTEHFGETLRIGYNWYFILFYIYSVRLGVKFCGITFSWYETNTDIFMSRSLQWAVPLAVMNTIHLTYINLPEDDFT